MLLNQYVYEYDERLSVSVGMLFGFVDNVPNDIYNSPSQHQDGHFQDAMIMFLRMHNIYYIQSLSLVPRGKYHSHEPINIDDVLWMNLVNVPV
jgi:hypothetical protein